MFLLLRLIVTDCEIVYVILFFFSFLELSMKYLKKATFQRSLVFHMSVLKRLEKAERELLFSSVELVTLIYGH